MKPKVKTLKNGLRILIIPQPQALTATALVLVGTGSDYEKPSQNGLSHFLEHMYFKGTEKMPTSKMIAESFDRLGSISNAFTSNEYTGYYAKGSPKNINIFIETLSDIYLHSTFPEFEIEKEKGVIIEEINMYEDMPQHKVSQALISLMYGDQPAGWPIFGNKKNVSAFKRKDFIEYQGDHYHAENTTIVVSGAVDEKVIVKNIEKAFKQIPTTKSLRKKKTTPQKSLKLKVIEKKSDQTHFAMGFHSLPFGHKDGPVISLLATILGRGMSSRLFLELREELGAAYYVSSGTDSHSDHGAFEIVAGVDKNRVNEIFSKIAIMLRDLKDNLVSIEELNKARDYALGMQRLHLESSDDIALFYGVQLLIKKSFKTMQEVSREYQKVTPTQIRQMARKLFVADNTNIAIIGPLVNKDIDLKPFSSL